MNPELEALLKRIEAAGGPVRVYPDPFHNPQREGHGPLPDTCYGVIDFDGAHVEDFFTAKDWGLWAEAVFTARLQFDILTRGHNVEAVSIADGPTTVIITDSTANDRSILAYRRAGTQLLAFIDAWLRAYEKQVPA